MLHTNLSAETESQLQAVLDLLRETAAQDVRGSIELHSIIMSDDAEGVVTAVADQGIEVQWDVEGNVQRYTYDEVEEYGFTFKAA